MSNVITLKGQVNEDGQLIVNLPPDAPRGEVEITIRKTAQPALELTPEEEAALDAEFEALMNDPATFSGLGLTAEEIANSPEFGAWAHRDDIVDGETFVENARSKRRY
jgi:hypothetical protein